MDKVEVSHHKAHQSPRCRTDAPSGTRLRRRQCGPGLAGPRATDTVTAGMVAGGAERTGEPHSRGRSFPCLGESLNWTLRRYVPALSLRVWLMRQAPETSRTVAETGRDGLPRVAAARAGTVGETGSRVPVAWAHGVSLSPERTLRYGIHRNRQMEHFAQVAISLRGGVRRSASITRRERTAAPDLASAT